jgi:starch synthase
MEILFASTELAPFVKVGGLADVAAALPKALRALGHRVTVVLPRYPLLESSGLLLARRLTPLKFTLGDKSFEATLYDARLASQVDLLVVDLPGLLDRDGVYGERGVDYPDNALRFAAFSRAVAEIALARGIAGQPVDVVHCHDWPTALVPTYLQALARNTEALASTRTVLTLHNVAHQGVFASEVFPSLGLPAASFTVEGLEFYGKLNFLKQGIIAADRLTTVSPTYAREIQKAGVEGRGGHGLEGVLASKSRPIVGILNGVDAGVWNPAVDPALAARYDAEDHTPRARCRGALQKELGLPLDAAAPIIGSVGRLVHQKGSDLVAAVLPRILRHTEAQVVICGDGDEALVAKLEAAVQKSHGRAVFVRAAAEPVVHRLYAAADLVLVPSRFEPCGLVQMYAQRYGALPVARATGGLVDTVVDCDTGLETGTGFLFQEDDHAALLAAIERGIAARAHARWPSLVRRVMRLDRGWERPARQYEQLFRQMSAR